MRKILLILVMAVYMLPMAAQKDSTYVKEFCLMKVSYKLSVVYEFDFGEGYDKLKDVKFKSEADALNYMSKQGWTLEPIKTHYNHSTQDVFVYVFSKRKE